MSNQMMIKDICPHCGGPCRRILREREKLIVLVCDYCGKHVWPVTAKSKRKV